MRLYLVQHGEALAKERDPERPLSGHGRADIDFLIERFQATSGAYIVVPTHEGARGNPVLLPAAFRDDLVAGGMNVGCRQLIDRNPERVRTVEAPNDHFTTDVDTPEAYAALA